MALSHAGGAFAESPSSASPDRLVERLHRAAPSLDRQVLSMAARAMLEARMEWAQDVTLALSEFVDYPALNLPTRQFKEPDEITPDEIELAASECRDQHP